ncbi:MAG TPA: fibrinogen-like YCDxxxxGGGW domain-containing protein [Kofleriaceae bacterium]|nr:fibrinogen-like YCDxxxxGGGW domain-containing protein [Kofleriaceae bacterium]
MRCFSGLCFGLLALAACGDNVTPRVSIGGHVSGLHGTGLVLQNNAGDDVTVSASGDFAFATPIAAGSTYAVTVKAQPQSPAQVCAVTNGSGTATAHATTDISVVCTTSEFVVSGMVTGLSGSGLVLQNNAGDDLAVEQNGSFSFATPVASGDAFAVTVKTQPAGPTQTCTVSGASGTVGNGAVTTVVVDCATDRFTVGGSISGLTGSVVLQNNAGDDIVVTANGSFAFPTSVASGAGYAVTVLTQPMSPWQTCVVANGSGTVTSADIASVSVTCTTNEYAIGGTVTGLAGTGLVLQNNGGDDLPISADGAFQFTTPITSGATYGVTVLADPTGPSQTCTVTGATGTVGGGAVTSVAVNCTTNRYTVGGQITGLAGTVVLQNNLGDDLTLTADGTFAFATPIASGSTYDVTVLTQPGTPSQTCTVTAEAGTVTTGDITTVAVSCVTNTFSIKGAVSGLAAGNSIVLQDNGGDDLTMTADGGFTFATTIASGQAYNVTVVASPTSPVSQSCSVTNGNGVVGGSDVTDVAVTCTTRSFTVGGTVSGLSGLSGTLVLQNNSGDDLTISSDGSFTFPTSVVSGQPYDVTVLAQPSTGQCTVANGSGTVGNANVTNVTVTCAMASCAALHAANPMLPSGTYTLDPDGAGPTPAFSAYCDMTTNGGGWTNLDFANNRILLANGNFVNCSKGLSVTANQVDCEMPYFDVAGAMPLYHYYCDGSDTSANYILDDMAPIIGHQASQTLGFSSMAQSYGKYGITAPNDNEYCYINGEVVLWSDPRCAPYNSQGNGNCIPNYFTLTL